MRDPRTSPFWNATAAGALMESLSAAGGARRLRDPGAGPDPAVDAPSPPQDARGLRGALRRLWPR